MEISDVSSRFKLHRIPFIPPQILLKTLTIYRGKKNFRLQVNFQTLISTTGVIEIFPI